ASLERQDSGARYGIRRLADARIAAPDDRARSHVRRARVPLAARARPPRRRILDRYRPFRHDSRPPGARPLISMALLSATAITKHFSGVQARSRRSEEHTS